MTDAALSRWSDVSATLLLPLYARALDSLSPTAVIHDPKAVEIMRALNEQFRTSRLRMHRRLAQGKLPRKLPVAMALRARYFDRLTAQWLAEHPGSCVVGLGCGLDSRFERVDDGGAQWFELDLPEVIEVRRRFFAESERRHFIARSVLDPSWIDELAGCRAKPVLFLAEGLFMYLREAELRPVLARMREAFPGSTLICELSNRWVVDAMKSRWMRWKFERQLCLGPEAAFTFGVRNARELEAWAEDVRLIEEWSYFDDRERRLGSMGLLGRIEWLRKVQWTAVYRLGEASRIRVAG